MNKLLSGTTWGEVPMPRRELNAADWMSGSYFDTSAWDSNYNEARLGEAIGRERKKYRALLKNKRTMRNGAVLMLGTVLMLMIVGTILG